MHFYFSRMENLFIDPLWLETLDSPTSLSLESSSSVESLTSDEEEEEQYRTEVIETELVERESTR